MNTLLSEVSDILTIGLSKGLISTSEVDDAMDTLHSFLQKYPTYEPKPARGKVPTSDPAKKVNVEPVKKAADSARGKDPSRDKKVTTDEVELWTANEVELWERVQPVLDRAQGYATHPTPS